MPESLLRILITDDYSAIRSIVRQFVESELGWTVCGEAVDGNDAVSKALELNPDLLLLDISMPQLGGWQACQAIRAKLPALKILIITEHDPAIMKVAMGGISIDGFIVKSEIASGLKPAVHAAMNASSSAGVPESN